MKVDKNNENQENGDSMKNIDLAINDDLTVFKEYRLLPYFVL